MVKFARPSLLLRDMRHSRNVANPSRDLRKVFFAVYCNLCYTYFCFAAEVESCTMWVDSGYHAWPSCCCLHDTYPLSLSPPPPPPPSFPIPFSPSLILLFCHSRVGIEKYIAGLVIKLSSDPATMLQEKVYISKLYIILVQVSTYTCMCSQFFGGIVILTTSLPPLLPPSLSPSRMSNRNGHTTGLPSSQTLLVPSSRTSESLCTNNMAVLKLLRCVCVCACVRACVRMLGYTLVSGGMHVCVFNV